MKKQLFLRNRTGFKYKKKHYLFVVLAAAILTLAVLFVTNQNFNAGTKSWLLAGLRLIIEPVRDLSRFTRRFKAEFDEKSFLIKENENLKSEIESLKTENAKAQIVLQEIEDLEKNLGRLNFYEKKPILGRIVFRPPQALFDSLIIDVGEKQGIKKDMKALAYGNVFIGRVNKVYDNSSEVVLISNFNHEENAILEKSHFSVIVKGRGNYEMQIELPRSFEIKIGEMAYTLTTKSYLIGVVQKIETASSEPLQRIIVKFPFNMQNLSSVFLVE